MNFVAVQTFLKGNVVFVNLDKVFSFAYHEDENKTRINLQDGFIDARGNIVKDLTKHILGAGGHVGSVVQ